jgi:hypothetical protein
MTEVKAIGLIGAVVVLLGTAMSVGVMVTHAPGQLLAAVIGISAVVAALAIVPVIKHYEAVAARRKREEILLSR